MKIKRKKKMYIGEVLEYVRKNGADTDQRIECDDSSKHLMIYKDGDIGLSSTSYYRPDDTFTVEVCEELNMDEAFNYLVAIRKDTVTREKYPEVLKDGSITDVINTIGLTEVHEVHLFANDTLDLIWSAESGIPESGVLEVDDE